MAPGSDPTPDTPDEHGRASRREPPPLEQIPVWDDPSPVMRRRRRRRRSAGRPGRAARRPQRGTAAGGDARRGAAARGRRRRHRQDPGHHAADRLAHRDASGAALGDPRADVHGQGRGRDAGPRRPARPVRLHGCGDRDVPRVRRPGHPRVRVRARAPDRTSASCRGRRSSSSCASTCSSSSSTSTGRSATRRGSSARSRRCSAAARTRTSSPEAYLAHADELRDAGPARDAGRRGRSPSEARTPASGELARAYARYQRAARARRVHRLRRPGRARPAARAESRGGPRGARGAVPLRPRRRVPGHEPRPVGACRRCSRSAIATSPSSATTTSRSTGSAARRSATSSASASATVGADRRAAPQLPLARADPRRVAPADPLQRSGPPRGPGRRSPSSSAPSRVGADEPPGPARGFATRRRGGGLDRRARSAGGSRPGRGRGTTPSWCGRTPTRTRSCAASTSPGIPWRFSGTSGLYARPEVRLLLAFLRAVADPSSSVDVYALAASEPYGLGGDDLTAIVNSARRRNRSVWEVLEELDRQPGILRLSDRDARGRRAGSSPTSGATRARPRAAGRRGDVPVPARQRACSPGSRRATRGRRGGAARTSPASSTSSAAQSALLADDRAIFVARHLDTLIEAGDDPPTRGPRPGRRRRRGPDRPQGEGPRVPGRVHARPRRRPVPDARPPRAARRSRASSSARRCPTGDSHLQEERRLFYVGDDPRARRADPDPRRRLRRGTRRRVSPFVLEALDLPPQAAVPGRRAATPPLDRIAAAPSRPHARAPTPSGADERAALAELLRDRRLPDLPAEVQVRPRPAGADRAAPRDDLRLGAAQGGPGVPPAPRPGRRHDRGRAVAAFEAAWTNEGFLTREHEEARLEAGRAALRRFRDGAAPAGGGDPGLRRAGVQLQPRRRPDPRPLGPGRHRARGRTPDRGRSAATSRAAAQSPTRVSPTLGLTGRERVTITDYKSSDVRDPAVARQRARDSLQLQIYAMGYEALTGRLPGRRPAPLPRLRARRARRGRPERLEKARAKIATAAAGMRARDYTPKPDRLTCSYCPYRDICPSSVAHVTRRAAGSRDDPGDHVRLRQHARPGRPRRSCGRWSRRPAGPSSTASGRSSFDEYLAGLGGGARAAVPRGRAAVPRGRPRRARSSACSRDSAAWPPRPRTCAGTRTAAGVLDARGGRRGRSSVYTRRIRRRAAARPGRRPAARAARRRRATWRSSRTGRSAATIDRYVEAAGWAPSCARSSSASASARSSRIPRSSRERGGCSATRQPDAILHVGDDWAADVVGASRPAGGPRYVRPARRLAAAVERARRDRDAGPRARTIAELAELLAGTTAASPSRDRAFAPLGAAAPSGASIRGPRTTGPRRLAEAWK